jgi:hypothetical protein
MDSIAIIKSENTNKLCAHSKKTFTMEVQTFFVQIHIIFCKIQAIYVILV